MAEIGNWEAVQFMASPQTPCVLTICRHRLVALIAQAVMSTFLTNSGACQEIGAIIDRARAMSLITYSPTLAIQREERVWGTPLGLSKFMHLFRLLATETKFNLPGIDLLKHQRDSLESIVDRTVEAEKQYRIDGDLETYLSTMKDLESEVNAVLGTQTIAKVQGLLVAHAVLCESLPDVTADFCESSGAPLSSVQKERILESTGKIADALSERILEAEAMAVRTLVGNSEQLRSLVTSELLLDNKQRRPTTLPLLLQLKQETSSSKQWNPKGLLSSKNSDGLLPLGTRYSIGPDLTVKIEQRALRDFAFPTAWLLKYPETYRLPDQPMSLDERRGLAQPISVMAYLHEALSADIGELSQSDREMRVLEMAAVANSEARRAMTEDRWTGYRRLCNRTHCVELGYAYTITKLLTNAAPDEFKGVSDMARKESLAALKHELQFAKNVALEEYSQLLDAEQHDALKPTLEFLKNSDAETCDLLLLGFVQSIPSRRIAKGREAGQ